jgi:hypothetical protein
MYKLLWLVTFAIGAPLALVAAIVSLVAITPTTTQAQPQVLAAVAPVLQSQSLDIPIIDTNQTTADARPILIKNYLARFDSPLEPHYQDIVEIADRNSINPNLLVAIAQQESNLCKRIPPNSYNCWGYGIYGDKVTRFESYPEALDTVARGLKKNYIDKGLITPEQIMAKYTPPSLEIGGPWAKGVNQFLEDLQ